MTDLEKEKLVETILNNKVTISLVIDETVSILALKTGEIVLDCANWRVTGEDVARSSRVLLTPDAASLLKQTFAELEKSPDQGVVMRKERLAH